MLVSIETSCDETALALSKNGKVLWEEVYSQIKLHQKYGGVVPELASREHLERLPVLYNLLEDNLAEDVSAVCASVGPGLKGCLLVGTMFAKGLAQGYGVPFVPVNHLEGHFYSGLLEGGNYRYPVLCLIVSGGHSELVLATGFRNYQRVCYTKDDAAGEAFDKVAKLLSLGYPGGPEVSKLAETGDPKTFDCPIAVADDDTSFSFSGIKTWVSQLVQKCPDINKANLCASFQDAVTDTLCLKLSRAVDKYNPATVVLAGGVACNSELREKVKKLCPEVIIPSPKYCTDNAAMIAAVGHLALESNRQTQSRVLARWPLDEV